MGVRRLALFMFLSSVAPARSLLSIGHGRIAQGFRVPEGHGAPMERCSQRWYNATLDHFGWAPGPQHWQQRYFVCQEHWRKPSASAADGDVGPIFFYAGNEANVELYLNATGLMWESAAEFGALLLFAEHRYYGESLPFGNQSKQHLQYLSSEQALADYAELLYWVKRDLNATLVPTVAFGGSYGGMLASWLRIKYPSAVDGAIAASAPIWSFKGLEPPYDTGSYAEVVTYDTSVSAGAAAGCTENLRSAWQQVLRRTTAAQWGELQTLFRLCPGVTLNSYDDVYTLVYWLQSAFDFMAMGNYPYRSGYVLNGGGELPAFPMRVACGYLAGSALTGDALLAGLRDAAGVFYNNTHDKSCYNISQGVNPATSDDGELWDYQFCTEMFQPMSRDGVKDAFFEQKFDEAAAVRECHRQWGVTPRPYWAAVSFGGREIAAASNIVFSNGELDPWSGGGVLRSVSDSLVAVTIRGGAHHNDLMWSNPRDPPSVLRARALERQHMWRWVQQARRQRRTAATEDAVRRPAHVSEQERINGLLTFH